MASESLLGVTWTGGAEMTSSCSLRSGCWLRTAGTRAELSRLQAALLALSVTRPYICLLQPLSAVADFQPWLHLVPWSAAQSRPTELGLATVAVGWSDQGLLAKTADCFFAC